MHSIRCVHKVVNPVLNAGQFHRVLLPKRNAPAKPQLLRRRFSRRQLVSGDVAGGHPRAHKRQGQHGVIVPAGGHAYPLVLHLRHVPLYHRPYRRGKSALGPRFQPFEYAVRQVKGLVLFRVFLPVQPVLLHYIRHIYHSNLSCNPSVSSLSLEGTGRPKWAQAAGVTQRPRGVRVRKPICIR